MFHELNNFMFNWIYIFSHFIWCKRYSFTNGVGDDFELQSEINAHQIIYELRLPRVIGAGVVGATFAVAGAVMQGITRNPLADAGVLGINAGAMFVVALSFAFSAYAVFLFNDCFLYWSSLKYSTYFCYWVSNIRRVNTNEINDCWSSYGGFYIH